MRGRADAVRSRKAPGEKSSSRERVVEIQRTRLLVAALGAIDELGYARVTVAHIAARARVSRRTFYDLFDSREDCLLAALQSVAAMIRDELLAAELDGLAWRERVRTGLWSILSFLEREPALARVVVVQGLRGGPKVLERRERILAELARVVDQGRSEGSPRSIECPSVTAEGLVGAAFSIVYGRLVRGERRPLTDLYGELMGLIVLPYHGPAAARREQARPAPAAIRGETARHAHGTTIGEEDPESNGRSARGVSDPLAGVPMRLTYRTTLVLEAIATRPGVSNRTVADLAGIADQGQISKLLSRLERLGLTQNTGEGHAKGEPNAWTLTPLGHQVTRRLGTNTHHNEANS
ncbi:MAG TPA: TetR/AcrR family transcriptional regulator [Solirubrobacteraceae bacterium]|nr:TetR/AcrR family transcriptional regulator [Solirubrobacteraceae bacterium]